MVLRHKDFATTERFYGATRAAEAAAAEIRGKLRTADKKSALVGGRFQAAWVKRRTAEEANRFARFALAKHTPEDSNL